jgi:LysR family transcriptional regulator, glycine cleavage system transcriptional activator
LSSLLQACCRQFVMPRLELFRSASPDIDLILQVSIPLLNVTAEKADLEVRYGTGGYTDLEHQLIQAEEVTLACSPSYLNEFDPFNGFVGEAEAPSQWRADSSSIWQGSIQMAARLP